MDTIGFTFFVARLAVVDTVIETPAGDTGDVSVSQLRIRPPHVSRRQQNHHFVLLFVFVQYMGVIVVGSASSASASPF